MTYFLWWFFAIKDFKPLLFTSRSQLTDRYFFTSKEGMGYKKNQVLPSKNKQPMKNKRRCFMPEPDPNLDELLEPRMPFPTEPPVYQVSFHQESSKRQRRPRVIRAQYTHTSILTAIRDCVFSTTRPNNLRQKRPRGACESIKTLICSIKNDIQKLTQCKETDGTDPFFILPAMLCKVNKLEECILKAKECEEQISRRKEMLITAKCIRKSLIEQIRCDEKLLEEKRKKLCCLIKSLQIFERQIKCSTRALMATCAKKSCPPKVSGASSPCKLEPCDCPDKGDCDDECAGKCTPARPASPTRSCADPRPICCPPMEEPTKDCTGMSIVYSKSCFEMDCEGTEKSTAQSTRCDLNVCDSYEVTIGQRDCDICEDPVLKAKLKNVSRLWLESARELINEFQ